MAGTPLADERELIYQQDVQGGASVSESVGAKLGSTSNFILNRIVQRLTFGVGGNRSYSTLVGIPYTFSNNSEAAVENYLIKRIKVFNKTAGTAGATEFKIERRPFGSGVWTSIFSVNGKIQSGAADDLLFNSDDVATPAGVVKPVLNISTLDQGDELRFVLISARTGGKNLSVDVEVSPI